MKKVVIVIVALLTSIVTLMFGYYNKTNNQINTYYQVYFSGEAIGVIDSEEDLLGYIQEKQDAIKEQYLLTEVDIPNEIEIQKIMTYDKDIDNIEEVYQRIEEITSFTIEGYQVTISNAAQETSQKIYVTDRTIFDDAVETVIETFVGTEAYHRYKEGNQEEIDGVGTYINDVYLDNEITIRKMNISVSEKIYNSVDELTKYLLYGTTAQQKKYITSVGDTIDSIAFANEISTEEFMISNPSFTSSNFILYPGQEVIIGIIDPQIQVTVEQKVVEETASQYKTVETIDEDKVIGYESVVQAGENGILKVSRSEKLVNGTSVYVQPISQEVLKPSVDRVIIKGGKKVSGVGTLTNWAWPTNDGWRISSGFSYRINPVTHQRELHGALDIAGTGYGSPIYAANNGVIITKTHQSTAGNYIVINHNNGYYTQYNHMSKFANVSVGQVVEKGQIIGYVGMTGQATGPHLHFAVWYGGKPFTSGSNRINPMTLYK